MGAHFNSNMLIGIVLVVFAIAMFISITFNRYRTTGFKGRVPIIIASSIIAAIGVILFIVGLVYEWPDLTEKSVYLLPSITQLL